MNTKEKILKEATRHFALGGYEAFSIRKVAQDVGVAQSVLYHHYSSKDDLLKEMFEFLGVDLGQKRAQLQMCTTAREMLVQRIEFQLDNAEAVNAVLKYFFAYRSRFPKIDTGYVPEGAYKHIFEVLRFGEESGEFVVEDLKKDAQVITHAINGFVMEYYPNLPKGKEKKALIDQISGFLLRALEK